jgi:hemolysin activation/secretion protein
MLGWIATLMFWRASGAKNAKSAARLLGWALSLANLIPTMSAAAVEPATPAAPAADAAAAAKQEVHFNVQEYRVLGNTVLENREIEALLYPMLGPDKQLADVEKARAALEGVYHKRGYGTVFVDIPPQDVNDGIVRLRVTEGKLHQSKVEGAKYFSERDIAAEVPAAKVGTVPSLTDLQQQLSAVNGATADRSVVPILKAGPVPGTVDLDLKVQDRLPLHATFEVNDDYTADTKPLRAAVGLSYTNLFAELDQVALQYQTSPQSFSEVKVFNAGYTSRTFGDGYRIAGSFLNSNSNVANVGGSTGVLGKGQIAGLRFIGPQFGSATSSQLLSLGLDYKHFRDSVTVGGGSADLVTPISYTNLSLSYSGYWRFRFLEETLSLSPNFGLRSAPGKADDFENKRYLGRPNYSYLRWDDSLALILPAEYRLTLRLAGQLTNEPLISNENYSIGGSDGVRGYLEAEELGDNAIKGSIQFQTPVWSVRIPKLFSLFAFFDAGHTHSFATLGAQPEHAELRSWGLGMNLLPGGPVSGVLTWADPLRNGSYTRSHDGRLLFSVRGSF